MAKTTSLIDDLTMSTSKIEIFFEKWRRFMLRTGIREGFVGQKMWVIPKSTLAQWAVHPMLQPMLPTDIGWFPQAVAHYRERDDGADEHILIFCVAGRGWYEVNGQIHAIEANEMVLIPRHTPHRYSTDDSDPWTIHWVHFVGTDADFFVHHLPPGEYKMLVDPQCLTAAETLFHQCHEAFAGGFILHRLIYGAQILRHLLALLFFNNNYFSPVQRASHTHSVESTLAFLRENLPAHLTLKDMADHAGLSTSHFSFVFRQQTGYSPVDYFIHLKIQHACTLLSLTSRTIHDIGYEIGYEDPYYFSRIFKKVIGMSPRQYREQLIP
jgi:AraC family transcriptional regulator, arabinose operon regulatory protein